MGASDDNIAISLNGYYSKASDEKIRRQAVIKSNASVRNKGIPILEYSHTQANPIISKIYQCY